VLEEMQPQAERDVYTIYGRKGAGKTTCAMGFQGEKYVLCFDRKSLRVKAGMYANDATIHVYDCLKYYEPGELTYTQSSSKTFDYTMHILQNIPDCDWIIIDGLERLVKICEMRMRYKENIAPFKGFPNMSLWKLRRLYLRQIHEKALSRVRRGLVYVTFTDKDEIIVDGGVVQKTDVPKWVDIVMEETDVVVRVRDDLGKDGVKHYTATIESSKIPALRSGEVQDITNGRLVLK
jgi:hypothetical protein